MRGARLLGLRLGVVLPVAAGFALVSTAAGCNSNARSAHRTIQVDAGDLCQSVDPVSGVWESTPWPPASPTCSPGGSTNAPDCCWLFYPGQTALDIPHSLGRSPKLVVPYLSFSNDGESAAPASGDTVRVLQVTDTQVTLENGTKQDFYLRLVLR